MIVVIPTARTINLDYLAPLIESGARFIVVDDSEGSVTVPHPAFEVFDWGDQRRMLGPLEIAIPRRNGACRDFGFYLAWQRAEPGEIIVALDDDCRVEHLDFADRVAAALAPDNRPIAAGEGIHFNVIDAYSNVPANVFPRGFPYSARPGYQPWRFEDRVDGPVAFNLGLWQGIFDVNAIDKLKGPAWLHEHAALHHPQVIVPEGALISACSMNMQFRRELIPAVFQLPMHIEVMPGWVIDRYGDIWAGFITKTLMDLRGDRMSVGAPMIRHLKEGSYERNIWQEHLCHLVNDEFIDLLQDAATRLVRSDYLDMMGQLTEIFGERASGCSSLLRPYLEHLVKTMDAWVKALS